MTDITSQLSVVHGGNRGRAIANGARAVYNTVRSGIRGGAEILENVGKAAGGAWAAKEAWDHFRGNNTQQPAPQQAPAQQP